MDIVLLCGGYGTRMGELTQNTPKQLLEVAGKPVLERVMEKLGETVHEGKVILVTNQKFSDQFGQWAQDYKKRNPSVDLVVLNDGTRSNEERLGAVGNMQFAIEKGGVKGDALILGTDNMFSHSLEPLIRLAQAQGKPFNALYDVKSKDIARELGIVATDANGKMTAFVEKPLDPPSTMASCLVYYLPPKAVPMVGTYVQECRDRGVKPDKTGEFIGWLRERTEVMAGPVAGTWFDMGHKSTLEQARKYFADFEGDHSKRGGAGTAIGGAGLSLVMNANNVGLEPDLETAMQKPAGRTRR